MKNRAEAERVRGEYACPMHPEVRSASPERCRECGMELIAARGARSRLTRRERRGAAGFRQKFFISLAFTVPVVFFSDIVQDALGQYTLRFSGSDTLSFFLSSVVFFYGGWVFLISGYREFLARRPGMMALISLAIVTAYSWSLYAYFSDAAEPLFWELTTLITVMLLGHWMEMRAVAGARGALTELSKLLPDEAEVVTGGGTNAVPVGELKEGMLVRVRPGGKIPADGAVEFGESEVNEALLTGESAPVKKTAGDGAIAGSINGDGTLDIRVMKIGEATFLSGIGRLIREAEHSKSGLQLLSDRAARYLTYVAIFGGLVTLIAWLAVGRSGSFAVERLVAVLVIACPHALGLAIPLVASISTSMAAERGFFIRDRRALEAAREVTTVLFDKTGTLTVGAYEVRGIIPVAGIREEAVLQPAASVEAGSEHAAARAIVAAADLRGLKRKQAKKFERLGGRGVSATIGNVRWFIGGEAILKTVRARVPAAIARELEPLAAEGNTIVYVIAGKKVMGAIALVDAARPESAQAVASLRHLGLKVYMITGDAEGVAARVAGELGITEYFARVLPEEKDKKIIELQEKGMRVMMVGDGVNDAPALARADVGVAIGAGTNVAVEAAGIILARNDPRDIASIISLSRETYRKMKQNLFWATGYNVAALPLAAGVLFNQGIVLNPAVAAFFMSLSTVIVAVNAVLLRRRKVG